MCEKIEVLGLQLDGFTAKEAMQEAIRYMETEPISTIEILAGTSVVELTKTRRSARQACPDGASHCGRPDALELSGIEDRTLLKEAETHLFLKMFLRYLKKGNRKVFLLAPSEERMGKLGTIWHGITPGLRFQVLRSWRTSPGGQYDCQ